MIEDHSSAQPQALGCRDAIGLIPWLLNGSLGGREKRSLLDHLRGCEGCRLELDDAAQAAQIYSQHVPSLALAEYSQGIVSAELSRERIEAHLTTCSSCREELALARSVDQAQERQVQATERFGRRREAGATDRRPLGAWPTQLRWLAAAAGLALLCLGVVIWNLGSAGIDPSSIADDVVGPTPQDVLSGEAQTPGEAREVEISSLFHDEWEPAEGLDENLFNDGFERGNISSWDAAR